MNPAVEKLTTSYALYARPGDLARLEPAGVTLYITGVNGKLIRFVRWRPSPLPRRLP